MNIALQITANLSIVLQPFLPSTAKKLSEFLKFVNKYWIFAGRNDLIPSGHQIGTPSILFQKIEDTLVENELNRLQEAKKANEIANAVPEPQKETVAFEDFTKLDIRLGTILEAKKVKKADKLLKLLVDTGIDKRTIVSGIAEHYTAEEVVGKTVSVLLNLAPRKIKGI